MENITREHLYELYDKVNEYGHYYHDLDSPLVADEVYDDLLHRIELTEQEHPDWVRDDSPSRRVSGTASRNELEKVPHEEPLLSLEDKFSSGEVANWYSNGGFLGMKLGSPAFDVEMKVDGLSVALEYVNGVFTIGSTRGDGRIGENVTENIKQVKGIPFDLRKKLKAIDPEFNAETVLRVRVEVVMLNRDFEKVNKERELNGEPLYANPRNAAAGTLRVLDPELVKKRGLTAIAFAVLHAEGFDGLNGDIKPGRTQLDDLAFLESLGFTVVPRYKADNPTDFDRAIEQIQNDRNDMPYWIDGAVIKVNSISAQNELGATSKYPRWAVAYKYKPEEKTTYVKQVIVQTGRTGILTPKVEFEPVSLGGTTVQYATLHNPGQIRALGGIAVGDEIVVSKAAEIIPQVVKVNTEKREPNAELFKITTCPSCGAAAELRSNEGIETAYCTNPQCPAQLQRYFEFAVSRNVLNIVGMGPSVISLLVDNGFIKALPDIYKLNEYKDRLCEFSGMGKQKVENMLRSIENSKSQSMSRVFASFGIKGCGTFIGDILEKNFADIWEVAAQTAEQLTALKGVGELSANEIVKYFADEKNIEMIKRLEESGVNVKSSYEQKDESELPLSGLSFVITGTLADMSRTDAKKLIEDNGGKVAGSVSKKTNYLVAGEAAGSKLTKARELGVAVISGEELKKMINN